MLGSAELVEAVAAGIARRRLPRYVLDPVMVATSGDRLLERAAERLIAERLVPLATLVTPNLDEAAILVGDRVTAPDDMERAGRALLKLGAQAALVKGGHLPREEEGEGDEIVDVLVMDGAVRRFTHTRLDTTSTHGTGCTLSAAISAGLAHGRPLARAVEDALDFVHRAIAAAPGLGLPEHFAVVTLDAFIVMPDHLHGIVIISGMLDRHSVGAQHAAPLRSIGRLPAPTGSEGCSHGSLGAIVRSFKSATTKRINEMRHTPEKRVWQRNYHDRIIRDDWEMQRARHYVLLNPLRWKDAW